METGFNYCSETAFFSSDEKKWINKIEKLAKEHPDEITILRHAKDNDGCVYAKLPPSWLRIQPKAKRNYTDEQIAMYKERLAKINKKTPEDRAVE